MFVSFDIHARLYIRPLSIILHLLFAVFMFNYFHVYTIKILNHFLFFSFSSLYLALCWTDCYSPLLSAYIYIHAYIYRFIFKHSNTPSLRLPSRHNITSIVHSIITIDNSLLICVVILSSMISSTCKQTQTEILTHSHYLIEIALWSWHRFAEHFPFDWNIQITCSSLIQWTSSYLYIWSFEKKHDSGRCIR